MRALMRSLAPTASTTSPPWSPCTGPGPMAANMHYDYADRKNGRKPITYLHPDLAEVLGDTQGLMIYQESMMRVAQKFAGYSLEEADNLRKAAGKKVREIMAMEREKFVAGCERTGLRRRSSAPRCSTSSSRSPTTPSTRATPTATAWSAYQTAWLKANHPVEYLAALLTSVKDDKDKTAVYLAECRAHGHRGAGPRRQPVGVGLHRPARRRVPGRPAPSPSGCRPSATWARAWSSASSPSGDGAARSPTSTTSASGSTPWCSTSGRSSR